MINYILADYQRIISRKPRIFGLICYELIFIIVVISSFHNEGDNFSSITLMGSASKYIYQWLALIIGTMDYITSFSYDFKAKTMQVAIGLGVSRLKVIICKLLQFGLVVITDILITVGVLGLLCGYTGIPLAPSQVYMVFVDSVHCFLTCMCSASLTLFIVFKVQNMLLAMLAYFFMAMGVVSVLLDLLAYIGPEIISRMQLSRFTYEYNVNLLRVDMLNGIFNISHIFAIAIFMAIGVFLCWLVFRKQELDF